MIGDIADTNRNREPMPIPLLGISDVLGRAREIHELIARRAYGIYECHGGVTGRPALPAGAGFAAQLT